MENPEEILHSLEEFAKMKPKDIPRELEEYLKFVAKTGDPVYQWSVIKSLFREKLINVISEFYESCSSMEIPPCPNVELFNYDLMKNFILEKLETFSSAPFTLQRICELLTSPRKEYTRIDKYMRALEKNILVVSTMEPGGRRTENGDGFMNGIESDHDHVPEPGNEINVEEMDDSRSWRQDIQADNHIPEPITFDNSEHEYHVSTSNQEIVCVQYVSVEPIATEGVTIPSEEVKETDISVTITAVNVPKEDNTQKTEPELENQPLESISKEISEPTTTHKMETEADTTMDIQNIDPIGDEIKDPSKEDISDDSPDHLSNSILLTDSSEKPSPEPEQVQVVSLEPESAEIESVSPETSVTSENLPCENIPSDKVSSSDTVLENVEFQPQEVPVEVPKETAEISVINEIIKQIEEVVTSKVDSLTETLREEKICVEKQEKTDVEKHQNIEIVELAEPKLESKEIVSVDKEAVQEVQQIEPDSTLQLEEPAEPIALKTSEESPKIEISNEVSTQQKQPETEMITEVSAEMITEVSAEVIAEVSAENVIKSDEDTDTPAKVVIDEISTIPEEKETPMEVDVTVKESTDSPMENPPTEKESEPAEPSNPPV